MDKSKGIKNNLLEYEEKDKDIKNLTLIGSSIRTDVKPDGFLDFTMLITRATPEKGVNRECSEKLGKKISSFVESILGGGKERGVIYEED